MVCDLINRVEDGLMRLETNGSPFLDVCFPKKAENLSKEPFRYQSRSLSDRHRHGVDAEWVFVYFLAPRKNR